MQRLLRRGSPSRIAAYLRCLVTTSARAKKSKKKPSKLRGFFEKLFSASRSSRECPDEGRRPDCIHFYRVKFAGQNRCIFTVPQALLPRIPCKYGDDLSCGRQRRYPRIARPVFHSRGLLGGWQEPLENVLQIRGGHEDGHQLEPLHFYGVPWPRRRKLKSCKKLVLKLTTFF